MPALYIPKTGTFDGILSQLETLRAVSPENYASLQTQYSQIKQFSLADQKAEENKAAPVTILQLTAFALTNADFKQQIETEYTRLKKDTPARKERFEMSKWQSEIKADATLEQRGLNLDGRTDFTTQLHHKLRAELKKSKPAAGSGDVLATLQADAKTLHRMLTPSVKITRVDGQVTEAPYDMEQFLDNPPDIIFIMGNNDLRQVDFMALLYHLAKGAPPHKIPKIYVSGFGGHGTMHDPVFARQEGETMVKRLLDLGVPMENIRVEHDAVDTGRNVKYMDIFILMEYTLKEKTHLIAQNLLDATHVAFLEKMLALPGTEKRTLDDEEKLENILAPVRKYIMDRRISIFDNILVSGTPGGLRRQTSTLEQQKMLPWTHISCLTPFEFDSGLVNAAQENYYYGQLPQALINFIYALREVASYLDYTLNTEFLSRRALPDLPNLRACLEIYADYYNLMQEEKYDLKRQQLFREKPIDGKRLAEDFIRFSQQKERGEKDPVLMAKLHAVIKPSADYFRRAFLDVEIEKLKQICLRQPMTLAEQASELDTNGTFSRQGLFTRPFFKVPANNGAATNQDVAEQKNSFRYGASSSS